MRINTSKSEAMVLSWKEVDSPLQVGRESLPQMEEFKYLDRQIDRQIERLIGAASAVVRTLSRSVLLKRELNQRAKLSIYSHLWS